MLKSLQQKLVLIFVLLITAIMLVMGTFLFNNVTSFYHKEFRNQMINIFDGSLVSQLEQAAQSENAVSDIEVIAKAFSGSMGIDSYRNYYILNMKTAAFLTGSDPDGGSALLKTPVIIDAMAGKLSYQTDISGNIMEYAVPLRSDNSDGYIFYITDNKMEMNDVLKNLCIGNEAQKLILGNKKACVLVPSMRNGRAL